MTIGIAAYGRNAGEAVINGVMAAEIIGRGAIGGFAVFSTLDDQGVHRQLHRQNGGITALQINETHRAAPCAAVITSGPNRPEPLSQFLAGRSGLGLVTGHRLPNRKNFGGRPLNVAALDGMEEGMSPSNAVAVELNANPELDAGLIAVAPDGRIGFGNSRRVARRGDLGGASRLECERGYALLFNSIYCAADISLAAALGSVVWSRLSGVEAPFFIAELDDPVPLIPAMEDRIDLDARNRVIRVHMACAPMSGEIRRTTAIYSRASVWRNDQRVGRCATEVIADICDQRAAPNPDSQRRFVVEKA